MVAEDAELKPAEMPVSDLSWAAPPETLLLNSDDVHVWQAALNQPTAIVRSCLESLTPDERARAARFHFAKDRNHFVVARGLLRNILGRYLKVEPRRLRFRYSSHGKPALSAEINRGKLHFNLSHSHERVLYAIAISRELGVDIEYLRPDLADGDVAERFFSPSEVAALRSLPRDVRVAAFFTC